MKHCIWIFEIFESKQNDQILRSRYLTPFEWWIFTAFAEANLERLRNVLPHVAARRAAADQMGGGGMAP